MCDFFLRRCESKIINYVDDTTLYACKPSMDFVLSKLGKDAVISLVMSKCLWSGWKWYRGLKEIASPFPCCPVNRKCSKKKTKIEKKKKQTCPGKNIKVHASSICHFTICILSTDLISIYRSRGLNHKIILVTLLFNIHICDFFLCHSESNTINYSVLDSLSNWQRGHCIQN